MKETIEGLLKKRNGYLLTSEVVAAGISKPFLAKYVRENGLSHVAHGVYLSGDAWKDDYYITFLTSKKIIYSHESALYLHQLAEREPFQASVTVYAGYNASHLRRKGIRVHQVKRELYEIGKSTAMTVFGNEVPVYDRERTVCDTILSRNSMDPQTYQTAIKGYMEDSKKDMNKLMKYARLFGIEETVKMYAEVLT